MQEFRQLVLIGPFLPEAFPLGYERLLSPRTKKADVGEHPKAFVHVGLLFNEPPGKAGLFFM